MNRLTIRYIRGFLKRPDMLRKIRRKIFLLGKDSYQLYFKKKPGGDFKRILFVLGCQRAGTKLMLRVFERDLDVKVFSEFSRLSSRDAHKIRLNPLDQVKKEMNRYRCPAVVLKPLVETQNAMQLLHHFPGSKILWMYRHFRDVALSNLMRFGRRNGINNLRPIVENDQTDWRAEKVPESIRGIILKHFSEEMNPYDAAALFWYARNALFFELGLDQNPDVMMCRYEDFVRNPLDHMKKIYSFLGQIFPGERIMPDVHTRKLGSGSEVVLSPVVETLCQDLLDRLTLVHQK